jgi:hypothetical protein
MTIRSVIKDLMTESDGQSFDWGAVIGTGLILVFIGISIYVYTVLKQPFEPVSWGTGGCGLFGGVGGYTFLKNKSGGGQ